MKLLTRKKQEVVLDEETLFRKNEILKKFTADDNNRIDQSVFQVFIIRHK